MEITSLPTDNLYKFYALAGISIAILSLGFLFTRIADLQLKVVDGETELKVFELEMKVLERDISAAEKNPISSPELIKDLRNRSDALDVKRVQGHGRSRQLQLLVSQVNVAQYFIYGAAIAGFIMSVWGFRLWYQKVQAPNDALLRRELTSRSS